MENIFRKKKIKIPIINVLVDKFKLIFYLWFLSFISGFLVLLIPEKKLLEQIRKDDFYENTFRMGDPISKLGIDDLYAEA